MWWWGYCIFVSETYSVIDGVFYDDGVTSPKTATWYNQGNSFTITPDSDGTTVSASTSSLQSMFADANGFSASYKFDSIICIEFDLLQADNTFLFAIMGQNNTSISCTLTQTGHYKIYYDGEKQYKYLDDELIETPSVRTLTPNCAVGFRVNGTGTIKFKNFVIYPI